MNSKQYPLFQVDRGQNDETGIFVDINKPKPNTHCFSGTSPYPSFELTADDCLVDINPNPSRNFDRIHLIVKSQDVILSHKVQLELLAKGAKE